MSLVIMEKVLRDYRSRLQANSRETERIKMYIRIIAFLRLSVVVVAALIVYLFRNEGVEVWGTTVLIGIVLFLSLAQVHDRWFQEKRICRCRDRIIHRELLLLEYVSTESTGAVNLSTLPTIIASTSTFSARSRSSPISIARRRQ